MFKGKLRKWIVVLAGVMALLLLAGAGTALAAPTRGPHASADYMQVSQTATGQELVGIVQSIDQAKQTFVLAPLPASQAKAVTIAYDAKTNIHNDHRTLQMAVGMHVVVHVMTRSDGSVYATEIEPVAAHWSNMPAGTTSGSYPYGSCDGTGPHGR